MNSQIVLTIAVLATLTSTTQGLFVKSALIKNKLSAASSLVPLVGGLGSGSGARTDVELPIEPAVVAEDIPTRFIPPYHATVPVYSYAPLYHSRVVYTAVRPAVTRTVYAGANFGGAGRAIGNLLTGSVKAIGDIGSSIKGAVGSALSSSQPSTLEASETTY